MAKLSASALAFPLRSVTGQCRGTSFRFPVARSPREILLRTTLHHCVLRKQVFHSSRPVDTAHRGKGCVFHSLRVASRASWLCTLVRDGTLTIRNRYYAACCHRCCCLLISTEPLLFILTCILNRAFSIYSRLPTSEKLGLCFSSAREILYMGERPYAPDAQRLMKKKKKLILFSFDPTMTINYPSH